MRMISPILYGWAVGGLDATPLGAIPGAPGLARACRDMFAPLRPCPRIRGHLHSINPFTLRPSRLAAVDGLDGLEVVRDLAHAEQHMIGEW